ncbi:hypothetical protein F5880DRAFT_1638860, partial [Lentinula raphanica]
MVYTRPMFTTLLAFGAASFVIVVNAIPIDTNSGPSLTSSAATSTPTSNSHTPTSTSPSQLDAATPSSHNAASAQSNDQNPQGLAPSVPKGTDPGDSHNHRQSTVPSVYDMVHGNSAVLSHVIWPGLRGMGQVPSKPDINKMSSHVRWPGMPNIRQGMPSDVRVSGMDISHDMGLRPSHVRVSGKDISDDMPCLWRSPPFRVVYRAFTFQVPNLLSLFNGIVVCVVVIRTSKHLTTPYDHAGGFIDLDVHQNFAHLLPISRVPPAMIYIFNCYETYYVNFFKFSRWRTPNLCIGWLPNYLTVPDLTLPGLTLALLNYLGCVFPRF